LTKKVLKAEEFSREHLAVHKRAQYKEQIKHGNDFGSSELQPRSTKPRFRAEGERQRAIHTVFLTNPPTRQMGRQARQTLLHRMRAPGSPPRKLIAL